MKKIKFILLAIILTIVAKAQAGEGNFTLSISSDGKLILQRMQLLNADGYEKTITKESGDFSFSNQVDRYGIYNLSVTYLNPLTKKIGGINVQLFLKAGVTKLVFYGTSGKYSVTGASADAQKEFESFTARDQAYFKKVMEFESKLYKYQQAGSRKLAAAVKDSLLAAQVARKKNVYEPYISQHPNDDLSLYAIGLYSSFNMENPLEVKALVSTLGRNLQETEEIIQIRKDAEENEKFMKGVKAPGFTQADTNGIAVSLSSFQGKYVLIDFWASWCKPCRAQNPSLVRLYKKYKDNGFTILGVSLDSKKEPWLKAIQNDKLEWQQISDLKFWNNAVAKQYKISHVPQSYLLDSQGVIIGKNLSEDELDQLLEKELSASNK